MRKTFLLISWLAMAAGAMAQDFQPTERGVKGTTQGMQVEVAFYSPTMVRVCKSPVGHSYNKQSLVVNMQPQQVKLHTDMKGRRVSVASDALTVLLNPRTGAVEFRTPKGERLLLNKDYGTSFRAVNDAGTPSYRVREQFLLQPGEPIYGIGQVMDGVMNHRSTQYHMQNENMFTYSPYFISNRGYAVYWDNYSISEFTDTPQDLSFEGLGHCSDYYFVYGRGTMQGVVAGMRQLTGKAPMLPLWSYGFIQSWAQYNNQQESLDVLAKYRQLRVPIDCVVQDWRYWPQHEGTDSAWNSFRFDPRRFPNPRQWVDDIHRMNGKLMIVAWPGFGPKTDQRRELDSKGMIIPFLTWPPNSGASPYDVFNPQARDIYWKYMQPRLFSLLGNDAWWLDSTEPDHIERSDSDYDLPTHMGSYRSMKNAYSLMHNAGIAENQKAFSKDKRVTILTRSGFVGQQRYGSNTWSGDVGSTWDVLEKHIPAALNFALMGIPNWNSDIGGYFAGRWRSGGGNHNPEFQELYVRWMQFATFCPMMRSHGIDIPREIYRWGERGTWCFDAQERMIRLRYRLLPYIYSTGYQVSANDQLFMRPLVMDYPTDPKVHDLGFEYLFGQSLLVAPVTRYRATSWDVYLPGQHDWFDFWTGRRIRGGQTVQRETPRDILPLYVRAGSILPFGPDVQYSTEKSWDKLEIRIYPGQNGEFTLYEDELDNYNYEQGAFSTIRFQWNDANRQLTIAQREGAFPGMLKKRTFNIVLMDAQAAEGDKPQRATRTVRYNGKAQTLKF